MSKELKPCPFCGGKAEIIIFNAKYGTVTVGYVLTKSATSPWEKHFSLTKKLFNTGTGEQTILRKKKR